MNNATESVKAVNNSIKAVAEILKKWPRYNVFLLLRQTGFNEVESWDLIDNAESLNKP